MGRRGNRLINLPRIIAAGLLSGVVTGCIVYLLLIIMGTDYLTVSLTTGVIVAIIVFAAFRFGDIPGRVSVYDRQTGLFNENFLAECRFRLFAQADRQQKKVGVIITSIDDFEGLDSRYGKSATATALKHVTDGLHEASRTTEYIFRIGGNEFLVLFSDISEFGHVKKIASRVADYCRRPMALNGSEMTARISFGYSVYPNDGETFEEVLTVARQRMYLEQKGFVESSDDGDGTCDY